MMVRPFTFIALVGESLLSDTIEISLQADPGVKITRLPANISPNDRRGPLAPDMIIADLNAVGMSQLVAYLVTFPETPFLGIEASTNRVIALSCKEHAVNSAEDLTRVIQETTGARNLLARALPASNGVDAVFAKREMAHAN
jgi:hypothetical protein